MYHNVLSAKSEGALSKEAEARIVEDEHESFYVSRGSFNVPLWIYEEPRLNLSLDNAKLQRIHSVMQSNLATGCSREVLLGKNLN